MQSNRGNPIRDKFTGRATALKMKEFLPFVTQYQPLVSNLKEACIVNTFVLGPS